MPCIVHGTNAPCAECAEEERIAKEHSADSFRAFLECRRELADVRAQLKALKSWVKTPSSDPNWKHRFDRCQELGLFEEES